jgi:hypothetical protein
VIFRYRSASEVSNSSTTHFEEWAGIYRDGKLFKTLSDNSYRDRDVWFPQQQRVGENFEQKYAYKASGLMVGDTVSFQVRACSDRAANPKMNSFPPKPRRCSKWNEFRVTMTSKPSPVPVPTQKPIPTPTASSSSLPVPRPSSSTTPNPAPGPSAPGPVTRLPTEPDPTSGDPSIRGFTIPDE